MSRQKIIITLSLKIKSSWNNYFPRVQPQLERYGAHKFYSIATEKARNNIQQKSWQTY